VDILANTFSDELLCVDEEFMKCDFQDMHGTRLRGCKMTRI